MMNGKDEIIPQLSLVTVDFHDICLTFPLWLCVSVIHLGSSMGPSIIILAAGDFH